MVQGRLAPGQDPTGVNVSLVIETTDARGDTSPTVIARDTVAADGTFALSMSDFTTLKKHARPSGRVDAEVIGA